MPVLPFMQVDAFTDRALGGNPCAILFDTDDLPAETMLAIARENNLSETAFVRGSKVADFGARYFTPAEEIPLAGHPTIATIWALIDRGDIQLPDACTRVTLELKAGVIPVDIYANNGRIERIVMSQIKPKFLKIHSASEIAPLFGISPDDILPDAPIQTVSTGTPQLMVPVRSLDVLRRVNLDVSVFAAYRAQSDFFSPHLFCLQGVTAVGQTFARHFGVPPDTMEDPFTGSATGGMGAYLWHYGLIEQPTFVAEQGHWMQRPGQGFVTVIGPREDIDTVQVGGQAVTVIRGEITIL